MPNQPCPGDTQSKHAISESEFFLFGLNPVGMIPSLAQTQA